MPQVCERVVCIHFIQYINNAHEGMGKEFFTWPLPRKYTGHLATTISDQHRETEWEPGISGNWPAVNRVACWALTLSGWGYKSQPDCILSITVWDQWDMAPGNPLKLWNWQKLLLLFFFLNKELTPGIYQNKIKNWPRDVAQGILINFLMTTTLNSEGQGHNRLPYRK